MPIAPTHQGKQRCKTGLLSSGESTHSTMTSNSSSNTTVEIVATHPNWIIRRLAHHTKGVSRQSSFFRSNSTEDSSNDHRSSKRFNSVSESVSKNYRSVRFACDFGANNSGGISNDATRQAVVFCIRTELTEQEVRDMYWSKEEINLMFKRSQKMAKAALKADSQNILACFYTFYGIDFLNQSGPARTSSLIKKITSSSQKALNYYYRYEAVDSIDITGDYHFRNQDDSSLNSKDNIETYADWPEESQEPRSSSIISTLRGLERKLSSEVADYRLQCIHAVLNAQAEIRREAGRGGKFSSGKIASILCGTSSKASMHSRRFARLLGKADAAIIGMMKEKSHDGDDHGEYLESQ